jgi:hypothetical protein
MKKQCSVCSQSFECSTCTEQQCWCSQYPAIMPLCVEQDCRCPACLTIAVNEKINDFLQNNPVKMAIPSQYINDNLIQDIDYYIENDNYVFTQWYHRKRGSCCGNGCRHCAYGHQNVR